MVEPGDLWLVLLNAYRSLRAHTGASIRRLGLIESDFAVLEAVFHNGPMRVNALGRKATLASSSITAAVDRLEGRGLVRRHGDRHDRRSRLVALTEQGSGLIARAFADYQHAMEKSAAVLSIEERNQLFRLLRKWEDSAESLASEETKLP
ncbi:MAG: MarR family transcriptional regulator [Bryobacteraceae bacterium]